jgi:hypothetical protein
MLFLHRSPYMAVVPVGPEPRSIAAAAWSCWRRRPRSRNVTGCGATAAPDPPLCTPCPLLGRTTESAPIQTDLCDWPRLAYQGLAVGGRLGAVSPSCRSALGVPLCPRVGGRCSFPGPQAGRGRRTGLMLGAFHPCQHRPPGYDPGGLGGGQWPITDGHRYAQLLARGGYAASAWIWWSAVERVDPDIARSWVQARAGGKRHVSSADAGLWFTRGVSRPFCLCWRPGIYAQCRVRIGEKRHWPRPHGAVGVGAGQ